MIPVGRPQSYIRAGDHYFQLQRVVNGEFPLSGLTGSSNIVPIIGGEMQFVEQLGVGLSTDSYACVFPKDTRLLVRKVIKLTAAEAARRPDIAVVISEPHYCPAEQIMTDHLLAIDPMFTSNDPDWRSAVEIVSPNRPCSITREFIRNVAMSRGLNDYWRYSFSCSRADWRKYNRRHIEIHGKIYVRVVSLENVVIDGVVGLEAETNAGLVVDGFVVQTTKLSQVKKQ